MTLLKFRRVMCEGLIAHLDGDVFALGKVLKEEVEGSETTLTC